MAPTPEQPNPEPPAQEVISDRVLRVFVGGDETQEVAAQVLAHSIRKHCCLPVRIEVMRDLGIPRPRHRRNRPRTAFSFYRFKIPELCGFRGKALYLDADMLVFRDIAELWQLPMEDHPLLCTVQGDPPPAWREHPGFQPGRQFSVMMLDCSRLPWDTGGIVRSLDEGRFTYERLLFDMCLLPRERIGETIPPTWNHLEQHVPGVTALTHFTVVPTQPWKRDGNPLDDLWQQAYREAVAAGAVDPKVVRHGIRRGFLKPSLEEALTLAPKQAPGHSSGVENMPAEGVLPVEHPAAQHAEAQRLRQALREARGSWTWRLGRLAQLPARLLGRG